MPHRLTYNGAVSNGAVSNGAVSNKTGANRVEVSKGRHLHKFGGSSLADPECYRRVVKLLQEYSLPSDLIVVSAAGKTTNRLIAWLEALDKDGRVAHEILQELRQFQHDLIHTLLPEAEATPLLTQLHQECADLGDLVLPLTEAQRSQALGHGELWSARLLGALLNSQQMDANVLDSRTFLRAERSAQPEINIEKSAPLLAQGLVDSKQKRTVITGFMASNAQGETVLLGRNGSDYSATVIGQLAQVSRVTIWSDVAGVFSADPREVSDACLLPWLRLDEANELARLAAPVLHSRTLQPVAQSDMDLHLRCSYQPESGSTRIERVLASGRGAKIITSLENIQLIEIDLSQSAIELSAQDIASYEESHRHEQNAQASDLSNTSDLNKISDLNKTSDLSKTNATHGVFVAEVMKQLKRAQWQPLASFWHQERQCFMLAYSQEVVQDALSYLNQLNSNLAIEVKNGYQMVAAVGAGVLNNAQHCHAFYQALKQTDVEFVDESKSGLSMVAILPPQAQLSLLPDLNLSPDQNLTTDTTDIALNHLVNAMHTRLFQAQKKVAIVLCGKGNIGGNWLRLFTEQQEELEKRRGMRFVLVGVIGRKRHYLNLEGISPAQSLEEYKQKATPNEAQDWLEQLAGYHNQFDEIVVMDVTASAEIASRYAEMAELGMHVICANKIAGSSPLEHYLPTKEAFDKTGRHWLYNATVGAGLTINYTIRDLRESGDKITAISGIFSGTLSWLFQQFDQGMSFSQLVDAAWQQGLTEPDPRSDLDGSDVMKKLVILAREAGFDIEPEQVKVESLVPDSLKALSLDEFFNAGEALDSYINDRLADATDQGKVLRYIARWQSDGKATVGLEALDPEDAFANLKPCDNIFAIESQWYKDNPLVIIGPGAGKFVTAGALQSDLNRLSELF